ncbi:unnamed protein product [Brugia timori]|uniref:Uncharacterized protein n=1 Tax=Brugia timori TaxID=42155 RepID=A0A0R3R1N4_9BILA|nr:unnamed protein product [Brugia timori]
MAKLLVYIAFIIYCAGQANQAQPGPGLACMYLSFFVNSLPSMYVK